MQILPAIDILDGAVVRLYQGDYAKVTVYDQDPAAVAEMWVERGADLVHVVDLEAARGGNVQTDALRELAACGLTFQVGGGIRDSEAAERAIAAGAARVVLGSVVTSGSEEAQAIVTAVGSDRVVAAIDVRGSHAVGSGWLDEGEALPIVVERVRSLKIPRALVTGIDRDGTMEGPDIGVLRDVRQLAPNLALIASGGVGALADVTRLAHDPAQFEAAIVGRALYERRFTFEEASSAAARACS